MSPLDLPAWFILRRDDDIAYFLHDYDDHHAHGDGDHVSGRDYGRDGGHGRDGHGRDGHDGGHDDHDVHGDHFDGRDGDHGYGHVHGDDDREKAIVLTLKPQLQPFQLN